MARISGRTVSVALAMAGLVCSSCDVPLMHHRQQARVFYPPPPPPKPVIERAPVIPQPPPTELAMVSLPLTLPNAAELGPPPPAPAKRPATPAPKVQANAPQPEAPVVSPPKLGQIFTPEQSREYNQALVESLARVDNALARLEGKNLSAEQSQTAERIRTFRRQAEQAREQDLVTAVSLARRADLLAKDLLGRLP